MFWNETATKVRLYFLHRSEDLARSLTALERYFNGRHENVKWRKNVVLLRIHRLLLVSSSSRLLAFITVHFLGKKLEKKMWAFFSQNTAYFWGWPCCENFRRIRIRWRILSSNFIVRITAKTQPRTGFYQTPPWDLWSLSISLRVHSSTITITVTIMTTTAAAAVTEVVDGFLLKTNHLLNLTISLELSPMKHFFSLSFLRPTNITLFVLKPWFLFFQIELTRSSIKV